MKLDNKDGYAFFMGKPSEMHRRFTCEVTFVTDMFPGAFYDPEDMVRSLVQSNPYIQSVELKEEVE